MLNDENVIFENNEVRNISRMFNSGKFKILSSQFVNCSYIFSEHASIDDCSFKNCFVVASSGKLDVLSCEIKNFENVLPIDFSSIKKSEFKDCVDIALKSHNTLENCEFHKINILNSDFETDSIEIDNCKFFTLNLNSNTNSAFISIHYTQKYNYETEIKNCLFEDFTISSDKYIVNGTTDVKVKSLEILIENCAFVNCDSSQDLLSLDDFYTTKFPKKTKYINLGAVRNCIGL